MARKKTAAQDAAELIPYIAADLRHLAQPIESLVDDPENARLHPEDNLVTIMRSLTDFGQDQPIVARKGNRVVVKGNARLVAARRLGWKFLAVVFVEDDDAAAAARAIADNRTGELARWDDAVLARLIGRIQASNDVHVESAGFTADQAAAILAKTRPGPSGEPSDAQAAGGSAGSERAPEAFPRHDETIPTDHVCPRCGFAWSGPAGDKPAATAAAQEAQA